LVFCTDGTNIQTKTFKYTEYNDANLCIPDNFETRRYLLGSSASNIPEQEGCWLESSIQYYSNTEYKSIIQKCYLNSTTNNVNKVYVRTGNKQGSLASWVFGEWKEQTTVDDIEVTAATNTTIDKNVSNKIGKQVSLTFRFLYSEAVQNGNTYKIATINKYKPSASYPSVGMYGYNVVLFYINTDGEIFMRPLLNNSSLDGGVCINYCID